MGRSKRGAVFIHTIMILQRRTWRYFRWVIGLFWRGVELQHKRGFCGYPVNRLGIKRPPNGMKFDRRSTGGVPRTIEKSQPIPRTFFLPLTKRDKRGAPVHVGVSDCETDNGENDRMHETNTYANAMHMMT